MSELDILPTKPKPVSSLAILAERLHADPEKLLATLKASVWKGATNEELLALAIVSNNYGLNPILKELYAFPAKGGGIVPIVSIDGWLRITNDHPQMDGIETSYREEDGKLVSCTAKIWRKDRTHPTIVTEFLSECKRNTEPWKMEHRMLRHKAIMQCARVAFGFSGLMDEDEGGVVAERKASGREVPAARAIPLDPFSPPDRQPAIPDGSEAWTDEEIDAKFAEEGRAE